MSVFHVAVTILFVFDFIPFGMFEAVAAPEKCTKQGSFEIVDGTCQNYYMCIFNGVELVSYELTCAPPTVFSPVTGYCTPSTQYPCTQSTTPSTTTVTTSSTPASDSSSSGTTASVTSSSGTTAPVSSSSGTTASVSSSSGTTAPVSSSSGTTAPVTSSPATTASVSSSTVSSTSTTATTTTKPTCLTTGRYPIPGSGCKMYYYCYVDGPNIINYTNLTCPTILVFSPTVQKCVLPTTYPCPS
ncbi:cell wall integrity and stress response component 4-like [Colletes gigas]|uniref:cell wall integrity and stress response component 4-like n=1 Tax=Colletes gigas TaxID=935657 RepID=UPI001C9ADCAD|nr:cell wall integrity and stress response component 4-like [Colletes gigas]